MIVVADTSPINYLILINRIELLPLLYQQILIPRAVVLELSDSRAPKVVRQWVEALPPWIVVHEITSADPAMEYLGRGERDGIALAQILHADRLLIDEQAARREAESRGFEVSGTLGILKLAARFDLNGFRNAIEALQATSFYISPAILSQLLREMS